MKKKSKSLKKKVPLKPDIMVEVERLASMGPELAEVEMKVVAGQLSIPVDRLRRFVDKRRHKLLFEKHKSAGVELGEDRPKERSQADLLVDLAADGIDLFHDDDKAFALIQVEDHTETWPVRSTRFRLHLRRRFHAAHQKAPGAQAVEDAINTVCSKALFDGPQASVHLRVVDHEGSIYVDL